VTDDSNHEDPRTSGSGDRSRGHGVDALVGFLTSAWAMRFFLQTQQAASAGPVTLADLAEMVDRSDPAPAIEDAAELAQLMSAADLDRYREQLADDESAVADMPIDDLIENLRRRVPDPGVALAMVELHVPQPAVDYLLARLDTRGWRLPKEQIRAGRRFILDWIDLSHGTDVADAWHELEGHET
jgi:hypothetical protein